MTLSTNFRTGFIALVFLLSFVFIMYYLFPSNNKISNIPNNIQMVPRKHLNKYANTTLQIPSIIHQTWKTGSSPPSETIRWRDGCKALNPSYEFRMYDDDDLKKFVDRMYPQYFPLFQTLTGVYMADMARLLLVYHYGGIYLDLDFYCFRPYSCLEKYARHQAKQTMKQLKRSEELTDLLVVSREPIVHAELFRNKSRVVIQDFFMASPKHPFLKWLLDDRMTQFSRDPTHPSKGPFSYSIDKDIDRYYTMLGLPAVNPLDIYNLPSLSVPPTATATAPVKGRRLADAPAGKPAATTTTTAASVSVAKAAPATTTAAAAAVVKPAAVKATEAKAITPAATAVKPAATVPAVASAAKPAVPSVTAVKPAAVAATSAAKPADTKATPASPAAAPPARNEIKGTAMKLASASAAAPDAKKATNTSANCTMPEPTAADGKVGTTGSAAKPAAGTAKPKGLSPSVPFSFLKSNGSSSGSSGGVYTGPRSSLIIELREEILHPLVDTSNARLYDHCGKDKVGGLTEGGKKACETINKKHFFNPSEDTMLVHMWTHTYLGWSFLRGAFNYNSYNKVEQTMKPTYNCPVLN